jgi:dihydropteroate synthase
MVTLPSRPDRIVVMGVLNVTPDSFSDGGRWTDLDAAVAHGVQMRVDGRTWSMWVASPPGPVPSGWPRGRAGPGRPGHPGADVGRRAGERRHLPGRRGRAALEAGATVVNDVSGGLGDPQMADVVRAAGCPWILMHWRGHSATMQQLAQYDDVVADVCAELRARAEAAVSRGVDADRLAVDPGLGFAKTAAHNWALLARLDELRGLGLPILVGASRKSFLGALLAGRDGTPRPVDERENATTAITAYCALHGVLGRAGA